MKRSNLRISGLITMALLAECGVPAAGAGEGATPKPAGGPAAVESAVAASFNPVKFDARQWVGIAKDAGMKYIAITVPDVAPSDADTVIALSMEN